MYYHSPDQDVQIKAVFGECEVLKLKKINYCTDKFTTIADEIFNLELSF